MYIAQLWNPDIGEHEMNATVMCYSKFTTGQDPSCSHKLETYSVVSANMPKGIDGDQVLLTYHRESIQELQPDINNNYGEHEVNATVICCSKLQHCTFLPPPLEWPG